MSFSTLPGLRPGLTFGDSVMVDFAVGIPDEHFRHAAASLPKNLRKNLKVLTKDKEPPSEKSKAVFAVGVEALARHSKALSSLGGRRAVFVFDCERKLDMCGVESSDFADALRRFLDGEKTKTLSKDLFRTVHPSTHVIDELSSVKRSVAQMILSLVVTCRTTSAKNAVRDKFVDWLVGGKGTPDDLRNFLEEVLGEKNMAEADDVVAWMRTETGLCMRKECAKLTSRKPVEIDRTYLSVFDVNYLHSTGMVGK